MVKNMTLRKTQGQFLSPARGTQHLRPLTLTAVQASNKVNMEQRGPDE